MTDIVAAMSALRERHGTAELAGIGIGVPGFIQFKEGIVRNANNLPFLENFAMRDALEQQLKSIVILENDANAAALGEKWMGAGRDTDDLILLTLGTGIGGGIISGGRFCVGISAWRANWDTFPWFRTAIHAAAGARAAWKNTARPLPSAPWRGSCNSDTI